jgi:hypothetical protein
MAEQFEFLEMLDLTIENKIRDFVNTSFPAKITGISKFEENQYVDVQPLVSIRYGEGSSEADLETPIIYSVPVVFPSGGGGILSFPLKVGEDVLIVISQRDLADWLESNGDYVGVKNTQRFDLTDAIAIPSIFTSTNNLSPNPEDIELKWKDMSLRLQEDDTIRLDNPNGFMQLEADGSITLESIPNGATVNLASSGYVTVDNSEGSITIAPSGEMKLSNDGGNIFFRETGRVFIDVTENVVIDCDGQLDANVGDIFSITGIGGATITSNASGVIDINGVKFTGGGNMETATIASGDINSTGTIDADYVQADTVEGFVDVTAGQGPNIRTLLTHVHGGVTSGTAKTTNAQIP